MAPDIVLEGRFVDGRPDALRARPVRGPARRAPARGPLLVQRPDRFRSAGRRRQHPRHRPVRSARDRDRQRRVPGLERQPQGRLRRRRGLGDPAVRGRADAARDVERPARAVQGRTARAATTGWRSDSTRAGAAASATWSGRARPAARPCRRRGQAGCGATSTATPATRTATRGRPRCSTPAPRRGSTSSASPITTTSPITPSTGRAAGACPIVVPGVEVTTYRGHWNAWGTDRWWEFREPTGPAVERRCARPRPAGAFVSVNHPKPFGPAWEYDTVGAAHAIEVWNGPWAGLNSRGAGVLGAAPPGRANA